MPDENDTTTAAPQQGGETTAATTTTQSSGEGGGKLFSQDEVNRIAAEAREQGRKSAHKQPVAAAAPAALPAAPTIGVPSGDDGGRVTLKQLQEQLDEEKMRRAFDKRASRRGLSDEVADDLFESFKAQRPTDLDAWFDKKSALYGFGKSGSGTSQPAAPPAAPTTQAAVAQSTQPPISDKGAPSPGGVTPWQRELSENPLGMSPAAVTAMMAELGSEVARKKIVEAGMRQAERIRLQVKATR